MICVSRRLQYLFSHESQNVLGVPSTHLTRCVPKLVREKRPEPFGRNSRFYTHNVHFIFTTFVSVAHTFTTTVVQKLSSSSTENNWALKRDTTNVIVCSLVTTPAMFSPDEEVLSSSLRCTSTNSDPQLERQSKQCWEEFRKRIFSVFENFSNHLVFDFFCKLIFTILNTQCTIRCQQANWRTYVPATIIHMTGASFICT